MADQASSKMGADAKKVPIHRFFPYAVLIVTALILAALAILFFEPGILPDFGIS